MALNARAHALVGHVVSAAERLKISVQRTAQGATLIDCGARAKGGLEAGLLLARICLADLAQVSLCPPHFEGWDGPSVAVATDHPLAACMASQYAGWKLAAGKFFAMGSGPMRAAAGSEALFASIGLRESAEQVVGVLETRDEVPPAVIGEIAAACGVDVANVTLLTAPTASQAGSLQIAARSVETAMHKLGELEFDLSRIESGWGLAPLPSVAADDLRAIGRTNDAILYGSQVTLWLRGDDHSIDAVGPRLPSSSSSDYGRPFLEIFESYQRDFYRVDPMLFSPAEVTLVNLDTGRVRRFGQLAPAIVRQSFES